MYTGDPHEWMVFIDHQGDNQDNQENEKSVAFFVIGIDCIEPAVDTAGFLPASPELLVERVLVVVHAMGTAGDTTGTAGDTMGTAGGTQGVGGDAAASEATTRLSSTGWHVPVSSNSTRAWWRAAGTRSRRRSDVEVAREIVPVHAMGDAPGIGTATCRVRGANAHDPKRPFSHGLSSWQTRKQKRGTNF